MKPYYSESGIQLYQGDCLEVLPALGIKPGDVALLWADPPYGINLKPTSSRERRGVAGRQWAPIIGDRVRFDPAPWLPYPRAVLWGANHYASRLPDSMTWWLWDKREDLIPERTQADGEAAWTNLGGPLRIFRHYWDGFSRASERGASHLHPSQKPEALASWGFQRAGLKAGDLVVSPYLGSGPEAAAAKRMGLRFIGVELVPEYLDACVARLRQGVLFSSPP